MLEITSKQNFDILSAIIILAKYNLQTSVSRKTILLEDSIIPTKVLEELCNIVPNYCVRNFYESPKNESDNSNSEPNSQLTSSEKEFSKAEPITELKKVARDLTNVESAIELKDHEKKLTNAEGSSEIKVYEKYTKFTTTGDVFFCDFGIPYEHEIGYSRPVIVLWSFSDRVLVLPCTTNSTIYEGKFNISLTSNNFKSCKKTLDKTDSFGVIGQLRIVDKARLQSKIGTLADDYFSEIMLTIQAYLAFSVTGLTSSQLSMLKGKISEIQSILNCSSDIEKIKKLLYIFGFSSTANGYSYLRDAILYSLDMENINITMLSKKIADKLPKNITSDVVERSIVTRFKEVLGNKYQTSDFVRLIKILLKEGKV